jgi:uncharacterized protein (TIGR02246 family)
LIKITLFTVLLFSFPCLAIAQTPKTEEGVRKAVRSFYDSFNSHGFEGATEYTTEDWNHINPFGGRTRGRVATLKDLREVHSTFLKGVTDTIEDMDVRFATRDVAVVTVTSQMSTYIMNGVRHENEKYIRTFVVVKRNGRWLIMQDQNTSIGQ